MYVYEAECVSTYVTGYQPHVRNTFPVRVGKFELLIACV